MERQVQAEMEETTALLSELIGNYTTLFPYLSKKIPKHLTSASQGLYICQRNNQQELSNHGNKHKSHDRGKP